jgi:hypothetical protein
MGSIRNYVPGLGQLNILKRSGAIAQGLSFLALALLFFFGSGNVQAQIIQDPTTWTVEAHKISGNDYDVVFNLTLKKG